MGVPNVGPSSPSSSWHDLPESDLSPEQKAEYDKFIQEFASDFLMDGMDLILEDD